MSKVSERHVGSVTNSVINYKCNANELSDEELVVDEELSLLSDEAKELIRKRCYGIVVKNQLRNPHEIIVSHQEEMKFRKQKKKESRDNSFSFDKYSSKGIIYKNFISTLPIHVSDKSINRL